MAIVLLVTTDKKDKVEIPILGSCTVGRSSRCDFSISDEKISGKHGSFEIDAHGRLIYTDLGSTNGSFINNSLITKTQLRINEVLMMGNTTLRIDEKKLNSREKIAIGTGIDGSEEDLSVSSSDAQTNNILMSNEDLMMNQDIKKKPAAAKNWIKSKNENQKELEKNSGDTKFLKLDENNIKPKKK